MASFEARKRIIDRQNHRTNLSRIVFSYGVEQLVEDAAVGADVPSMPEQIENRAESAVEDGLLAERKAAKITKTADSLATTDDLSATAARLLELIADAFPHPSTALRNLTQVHYEHAKFNKGVLSTNIGTKQAIGEAILGMAYDLEAMEIVAWLPNDVSQVREFFTNLSLTAGGKGVIPEDDATDMDSVAQDYVGALEEHTHDPSVVLESLEDDVERFFGVQSHQVKPTTGARRR